MFLRPPISTRTATLFPSTTLFLSGRLLTGLDEARAPDQIEMTTAFGTISSDLRVGVDVTRVATLRSNDRLSSLGYALYGNGFILTEAEALQLGMGSDPVASRIDRKSIRLNSSL